MESKSRIATSPNGNGGWYLSLKKAGYDKIIAGAGIEWLNVLRLIMFYNVLQTHVLWVQQYPIIVYVVQK